MMAYLLSDLWIEIKYRLIKMFIVSLKISDYNLFIELTVQGLRHYWFLNPLIFCVLIQQLVSGVINKTWFGASRSSITFMYTIPCAQLSATLLHLKVVI